ncbi:MocR-like pyridoxine biosynthesis transcription factor PdxR [Burkholderia thailandensis]|uniref:MocR-like pyridoxine biosynthesis transcription factor PdxR n=1 Tax=Burkholderia thailandensis TaxID=57975 RepID=UPI0005B6D58C|nr:PLP-dependent aminotransferase family protein [Burkholderia thailandensis]AVR07981.1 PLP-dependent aminotransferase family protein [Burkholderia thailandensis]KIS53701.1 aminotransferase class I and II family protein [Burkholderia thailandensis Phuket 4W-1]MCS6505266.1 PLP-dependent aminotransferase family protein [Burkholderia thailandensis]
MDYGVLLSNFERDNAHDALARASQQHRLYACLRAAILNGTLEPGTYLMSSRALAETLRIARNTVLYAYERLAAEGFVVARRQGTMVARVGLPAASAAASPANARPALARRVAALPEIDADDEREPLPFLPGMPALDQFPLAPWRRALERAWRRIGPAQLGHAPLGGNLRLRQAIAEYLRVSRGIGCDAQQVFVTDGTQHGLDLCARTLADAGDTVWIENPGYAGARAAFEAADLRLVPIPVDADGLAPSAGHWRAHPPRLVYITPSHQYPLGAVMSVERRLALVANARAAGAWIVEDDYDSEFRHFGAPLAALQSLGDDAPVVYLGTFSKTMFPTLRIGFVVAPAALAPELRRTIGALAPRGRLAEQLALADFIEAGHFTRHLRRMRRLYDERRGALQDSLARHLGGALTVSGGAGGMHLSARLDAPVADVDVARAAQAHAITVRPLSRFCLPGTDRAAYNGLVLGYGAVPTEQIDACVRRLGIAIDDARHGARKAARDAAR